MRESRHKINTERRPLWSYLNLLGCPHFLRGGALCWPLPHLRDRLCRHPTKPGRERREYLVWQNVQAPEISDRGTAQVDTPVVVQNGDLAVDRTRPCGALGLRPARIHTS